MVPAPLAEQAASVAALRAEMKAEADFMTLVSG